MLNTTNTMRDKFQKREVRLVDAYNLWFDVVPANTPKQLEEAYRLRYQVYCKENTYETPDDFPEDCETDEFDTRSAHSLLLDRSSGSYVGTVRLILPLSCTPERSFPIQRVCGHPLLSDRKLAVTKTAAEISRFAISKEYRQRALDSQILRSPTTDLQGSLDDKRLLMPSIALGLIKAILQMSVEHGITDLFAVMEPSLLRLLARFGIYFRPIGPLVDYHGMRQPCYSSIESLLQRVFQERLDAWEIITDRGRLLRRLNSSAHLCG